MEESNLRALDINLIATMSEQKGVDSFVQASHIFTSSPWYFNIVYVL